VSDHAPAIPYAAELKRKALHLGALALPVGLLALGRTAALFVLVPLALVAVFCDVARQRWAWMHAFIRWVFAPIMRPEEQPPFGGRVVINGATWMCVSAAACALAFPEPVAAAALVMLMVGDGAAAVVGRRYGRHRYPFGLGAAKSLEGSAAFFATGLAAALPAVALPPYTALTPLQLGLGALAATVVEALPVPVDDNVRVPLVAGLVMVLAQP
jgi:dolichol kinase